MRNVIRNLLFSVAPVETRYTLNDMLSQVNHTMEMIKQAPSLVILNLLSTKIDKIAAYYKRVSLMPYWVNKLRTALLVKRVELIGREYSNEEA